jgi:hypothetical protein
VSSAVEGAAIGAAPSAPRDWENSFGRLWKLDLAIMAIVVTLFGAVRPLGDPDLPMHLAIGEWIVRHRAVPFVEPFAWTAVGQPYFAYSWLPQTTYFLVFSEFGALGLRALQGVLVLATACSALMLARAEGWRPSIGIMLGAFNLIVGAFFVAMLRPQAILLITMPLLWALFIHVARGTADWRHVAGIFLASALTANSHLFFPITLAPAVLLWVHGRLGERLSIVAILAVLAGWMVTPYSLHWPSVYRLNFGHHALTAYPSPISEMQPGFAWMLQPPLGPLPLLVALMLVVPWLLDETAVARRKRIFAAAYWTLGVILFGYAVRLFVLWWVLAILPFGWGLYRVASASEDAPPRLGFRVFGLVAGLAIVAAALIRTRDQRALEGSVVERSLPTAGARPAESVARWLLANTDPGARGRIMTSFAFGSYLTWRLPGYSASIDSRGLQPDSVTAAEAVVSAAARDYPVGPWRSADLAILPARYRAAAVLDSAPGWRRLLTVPGQPTALDSAALWVKLDWWQRHARPRS